MSRKVIDRRHFLAMPLALFLAPLARAGAAGVAHKAPYGVDVSLLYGALTYRVEGSLTETIDRPSGRYEVAIAGGGMASPTGSSRLEPSATDAGARSARARSSQ